jgi:hypothetical protein
MGSIKMARRSSSKGVKIMELYNKEFVYFDWDDTLEGKKGFVADSINDLKQYVKNNIDSWFGEIHKNTKNGTYPFESIDDSGVEYPFKFCYYDPYYEFRRAYLEGKQLQYKARDTGNWIDVVGDPVFKGAEYRIKPKMWYIVLDDCGLSRTNLKSDDDVMFEGTEEECIKWMDKYGKFEKIMLACRQGKAIQYKDGDKWTDWMLNDFPRNGALDGWKEWRIKDEVVESVPFDTVHELIDAWDSKYPQNKNRPEGTMPLIWVKSKATKCIYLINGYDYEDNKVGINIYWVALGDLFKEYTFLDSSIIGKVREKE